MVVLGLSIVGAVMVALVLWARMADRRIKKLADQKRELADLFVEQAGDHYHLRRRIDHIEQSTRRVAMQGHDIARIREVIGDIGIACARGE